MPYNKPPDRIKALPKHAQDIWTAAFNAAWKQYDGDESRANATAWAAVKNSYEQDSDGKWVKKEKEDKEDKEAAKIIGQDLSTFVSLTSPGDVWSDLPGWAVAEPKTPPEWIRVLPLGKVVLNDDRKPFTVTTDSIKKVIEKFLKTKIDMVIDYEHQTMSGDKAPAAGWVKELKERDDGLWAYVKWTDSATDHIKSKEYRYYSPTVRLDANRHVMELLHIGLTNFPAIQGIPALSAKKESNTEGGEYQVDLIMALKGMLGLEDDSMDHNVLLEVRKLKDSEADREACAAENAQLNERIKEMSTVLSQTEYRASTAELSLNRVSVPITITESLGISKEAKVSEVVNRIESYKLAVDRVKELELQLADSRGLAIKTSSEQMIQEALKTGRTTTEELERGDGKLRKYAETDPEFFRMFVLGRPENSVVPLQKLKQTGNDNSTMATPEEEKFMKQFGLTLEQFKQQKERESKGETFVGF